MPAKLIQDYLQTQGLRLPSDDIRVAYLTAQTVMNMGNASIEYSILWPKTQKFNLSQYINPSAENETILKQIFMALDSVFSRSLSSKSAAIYAIMPSESLENQLICLTQQGLVWEHQLAINEESSFTHLACRTAQSGWLNIVNDVPHWLSIEEIKGERHQDSASQLSIPICRESGALLGVIYVEYAEKNQATEAEQVDWIALALALSEPLKNLLPLEDTQEEKEA